MLKIVHLCYYYGNNTSGAPIAATRMHQALLRAGVESHYVCIEQREPGENVHVLPSVWLVRKLLYIVVRVFWVLSKLLTGKMLMPNLIPLIGLKRTIEKIAPDVIHIQYIGQDMMSFSQIAKLTQPKVFTLHDLTIVNALDPHPMSDRRFEMGFVKGNSSWLERWMFNRKKMLISKVDMLFTGPSKWVCDMFKRSIIGKGNKVHQIPNIVDPAYFYNASLIKPHDKFTILFGAYGGRKSKYKGWVDLVAALDLLPEYIKNNVKVHIFGEAAREELRGGIEFICLGEIDSPDRLCREYHAADVFALPSRYDNAPQVKFEALMTGLPVLAFQRTGCAEYIDSRINGWIASDGDLKDYAKGLEYFYSLFKRGELNSLRPEIAIGAKALFTEEVIIDQIIKLYLNCAKR